MLRTLLRIHALQLRNRVRAARAPVLTFGGVAVGAALFLLGLYFAGRRTLPDLGAGSPDELRAAFDRTFWVNVVLAFVLGYTTFEGLYRSPSALRLEALPLAARTLFIDRVLSLFAIHLPLLFGVIAFQAPLQEVSGALFAHALVVHGATWAFGVAAAIWLHLLAGRSLLTGGSAIKAYFGSGFRVNDAAMVLYSPAAVFAVLLFLAIPLELFARPLVLGNDIAPLLVALAALAVSAVAGLVHAGAIYRRHWLLVRARFTEAEVLPAWRELDVPTRVPGEFALRWLAEPLAGLYRKDLLQLRRRHRVDLLLIVAFVAGLALLHVRTSLDGSDLLLLDATLLALGVAVVLNPIYKLAGRELEPPGFLRVLPVAPARVRLAKVLVSATHQVPLAVAIAALYGVRAGDPVGALGLLVGGVALGLGVSALFARLALGRRHHGAWLPWLYRAALAAVVLLIPGVIG